MKRELVCETVFQEKNYLLLKLRQLLVRGY